jgi:hypothetical protein
MVGAMSIHRVIRKSGDRFVVRYRDPDGVNRSRAFPTLTAAERFHRQVDEARARRRERQLEADLERF